METALCAQTHEVGLVRLIRSAAVAPAFSLKLKNLKSLVLLSYRALTNLNISWNKLDIIKI